MSISFPLLAQCRSLHVNNDKKYMYLHVYFLDTLLQKSQFKKTWEAEIIHYTELLGMHYFLTKIVVLWSIILISPKELQIYVHVCTFWYEWYIALVQLYILISELYRVWWSTSVGLYQTLYLTVGSRCQVLHSNTLQSSFSAVVGSVILFLSDSGVLGDLALVPYGGFVP